MAVKFLGLFCNESAVFSSVGDMPRLIVLSSACSRLAHTRDGMVCLGQNIGVSGSSACRLDDDFELPYKFEAGAEVCKFI